MSSRSQTGKLFLHKFIVLVSITSFFVVAILQTTSVSAQGVNDFVIQSFDASYQLTNEDPQGSLTTTEKIKLNFSGQNRGILRAIPATYGDTETNPKVLSVLRDGTAEPFITYEENDNMIVRIGNPDVYITGEHAYEINYTVENVIRFYDGYDELYWDINGDQWGQVFEKVSGEITSGVPLTKPEASCYTGSFGAQASDCVLVPDVNRVTFETTAPLDQNQTLTVAIALNKGYFTPPSLIERYRWVLIALPIVLLQWLVVRKAHAVWLRDGKDYANRGVIAPYFERPKNVSLMQAGYIAENKLLPKHISAAIIDLAIRGYIRIIERKDGRSIKHDLSLLKTPDASLSTDEQSLLSALFTGTTVGSVFELEKNKYKLAATTTVLSKSIEDAVTQKGYYELSPSKANTKLIKHILGSIFLGIIGFVFAEATHGISVVSGVITFIVVVVYAAVMTKRSVQGALLKEHMEGLKLYLNTAEKERIAKQDAVGAELALHAAEPVRNVAFFEKLLPFAVSMGVEKSWAKAFSNIYQQPPDWYAGNWNTFNTAALVSSLGSTASAVNTSFSAPASSGSSGSGGGGFSGGGGGGGGGGGW